MSTRYFGMGKTYKTAQEAFKEPDYYVAIQRPKESEYEPFWSLLGVVTCLVIVTLAVLSHF